MTLTSRVNGHITVTSASASPFGPRFALLRGKAKIPKPMMKAASHLSLSYASFTSFRDISTGSGFKTLKPKNKRRFARLSYVGIQSRPLRGHAYERFTSVQQQKLKSVKTKDKGASLGSATQVISRFRPFGPKPRALHWCSAT